MCKGEMPMFDLQLKHYISIKVDQEFDLEQVFRFFQEEEYAIFLDTKLQKENDPISRIARKPRLILEKTSKKTLLNGVEIESFEDYLDELVSKNQQEANFCGGLFGYLSYEYGKELMQVTSAKKWDSSMALAVFVAYHQVVEFHHKLSELRIFASNLDEASEMEMMINNGDCLLYNAAKAFGNSLCIQNDKDPIHTQDYQKIFEKMVKYMYEGDIYVANLTRQIKIESLVDPYEVFLHLRTLSASAYGAFFRTRNGVIISSSPEEFFNLKNQKITTSPIKGTRARGVTEEDDERLKLELQESEKDFQELLMITDLERNDLHKICIPGTVEVEKLYEIHTFAQLHHAIATVSGVIKEKCPVSKILEAMFPGGSITGAPKYRAMQIIEELEEDCRGIYTGSLGMIGFNHTMQFNIMIRTLLYENGCYSIGVGGGITHHSEVLFELEETKQKAAAMIKSIECAEKAIFSTIRLDQDELILFDRHQQRFERSLVELDLQDNQSAQKNQRSSKLNKQQLLDWVIQNRKDENVLKIMSSGHQYGFVLQNRNYPNQIYQEGVELSYAKGIKSMCKHKFCDRKAYDEQRLKAYERGIMDLVLLNEKGQITEGTVSNIFFVIKGKLYTPSLECGLLPGIIRGYLLEHEKVEETYIYPYDLDRVDEVFITNSLMGLVSVRKWGDYQFNDFQTCNVLKEKHRESLHLTCQL
jgi:para-aminobenzoate synthetase component 1